MGRVKGTILVPLVKVLRSNREQASPLLPPALRKYVEERVLPSSWYPAKDHIGLLQAVRTLLDLKEEPFLVMGRAAARHDLAGIYRAQLQTGDPHRMLSTLTALWRTYCDSGQLVPQGDGPSAAYVELSGYVDTSREMCGIVGGYIIEAVTMAGAQNPQLRKIACKLEGAPACRWHVAWTPT
jgi:hypothetical protein